MNTKSFRDLIVWQKSKDLAVLIYKLTESYPREEIYGITSQMRRAVISISSNIAESYHRFHKKEKNQFLAIAFGSGAELESQLEISKALFSGLNYRESEVLLMEVMRILNSFLKNR
jgi:four helix bundle protein